MTLFKTPPPGMSQDGVPKKSKADLAAEIAETEERIYLREGLPFLHGWKWYKWARDFKESKNKIALLCAANQISKSSTQIRTVIDWATDKTVWPDLWSAPPIQFWYLYPTKEQATIEFETKWKEFLPKGKFKDDEYYGWEVEKREGHVKAIHFKSGVHIYFKTYAQDVMHLQSGTCNAIFCDEELPMELYEELMFRLSATDGYFRMVFTATLGQDFWRRAMEPEEHETEALPQAFKQTISLYDAMFYEDGTASHWTEERIARLRQRCSTTNEVLKRIYGKFIVLTGRKYEAFDIKRHMQPRHPLPRTWLVYCGVDPGSGGESGHPAAIAFVAVSPDFRKGRVIVCWRGDKILTTAGDVVEKYNYLVKENKLTVNDGFYDWGSKDFHTIASRMGLAFQKAEKDHATGENIMNTLFKNDMLLIYDDADGESAKLSGELATLKRETAKRKAKDNLADALRYAVTKIPWDFSIIGNQNANENESPEKPMNDMQREIAERRKQFDEENDAEGIRIEDEFAEWNESYGD